MRAGDWAKLGWIWVVWQTLTGLGLLIAPLFSAAAAEWFEPGRGNALLLIAASILFIAVWPSFGTNANRLVSVAGLLAALFGYAGTWVVLEGENKTLLAFLTITTFYFMVPAYTCIGILRLVRILFAAIRQ